MARDAGFSNINIDLMSAIPEQTYADWEKNLRTVAGLSPEHISAYSLILEEGTVFYDWYEKGKLDRGAWKLPSEEEEYAMGELTILRLAEAGMYRYEISNYAKPGFACRHNIGYWKRTDYLGFGPSAASLFGNRRWTNTADRS